MLESGTWCEELPKEQVRVPACRGKGAACTVSKWGADVITRELFHTITDKKQRQGIFSHQGYYCATCVILGNVAQDQASAL